MREMAQQTFFLAWCLELSSNFSDGKMDDMFQMLQQLELASQPFVQAMTLVMEWLSNEKFFFMGWPSNERFFVKPTIKSFAYQKFSSLGGHENIEELSTL